MYTVQAAAVLDRTRSEEGHDIVHLLSIRIPEDVLDYLKNNVPPERLGAVVRAVERTEAARQLAIRREAA